MDGDGRVALTDEQRRIVESPSRRLAVAAGPGTGKTRVLTTRLAHRMESGDVEANRVLVVTFTRRAAGELRRRLAGQGHRSPLAIATFHSAAWALLRRRLADLGRPMPNIARRPDRLIADALSEANIGASPNAVLADLGWAGAVGERLAGDDLADRLAALDRDWCLPPDRLADIGRRYRALKRARRVIDLDDVVAWTAHELTIDDGWAEAVRWRFPSLYVDEAQDLNQRQIDLLTALAGPEGTAGDAFVVGDPDQSIYGWNGSAPDAMARAAQAVGGCESIDLTVNHRSPGPIVAAGEAVLAGQRTSVAQTAAYPVGSAVEIHRTEDPEAEAALVAAIVSDHLRDGSRPSAIGVLARTTAEVETLAKALDDAGVIVRRRGRRGGQTWEALAESVRGLPGHVPARSALADLAGTEHHDPATDLVESLIGVHPEATVADLAEWMAASDRTDADSGDGVSVGTVHSAKGLEWPVVVVAGASEGRFPMFAADDPRRDEEIRLLYVAVTRAARRLHVTWSATDIDGRRCEPAQPLAAIGISTSSRTAPAEPGDWRAQLQRSRAAVADGSARLEAKMAARRAAMRRMGVSRAVVDPPRHQVGG